MTLNHFYFIFFTKLYKKGLFCYFDNLSIFVTSYLHLNRCLNVTSFHLFVSFTFFSCCRLTKATNCLSNEDITSLSRLWTEKKKYKFYVLFLYFFLRFLSLFISAFISAREEQFIYEWIVLNAFFALFFSSLSLPSESIVLELHFSSQNQLIVNENDVFFS